MHDRDEDVWYPIRASAINLAAETKRLHRRAIDVLEPEEQVARIAPLASSLLSRALELLDHVVSTCGLTSGRRVPAALPFELAVDTAVRAAFDVGDLAELLRVELRRRRARLSRVGRSAPSVALVACDHAIAGVSKALAALELAAGREARRRARLELIEHDPAGLRSTTAAS
jgi:hypothetical protein